MRNEEVEKRNSWKRKGLAENMGES